MRSQPFMTLGNDAYRIERFHPQIFNLHNAQPFLHDSHSLHPSTMSFLCPRILAPPSSSFSTRPLHQLLRPTLRCLHHPSPSLPTTARRRTYKTIQEARSRARSGGPFSVRAALLFVFAGCGMYAYFRFEKARMERKRIAEASKGMGRPKVGGEFELVDQWGGKFGSERLRGGFSLVSLWIFWLWE